jgi:hypothetical protein
MHAGASWWCMYALKGHRYICMHVCMHTCLSQFNGEALLCWHTINSLLFVYLHFVATNVCMCPCVGQSTHVSLSHALITDACMFACICVFVEWTSLHTYIQPFMLILLHVCASKVMRMHTTLLHAHTQMFTHRCWSKFWDRRMEDLEFKLVIWQV